MKKLVLLAVALSLVLVAGPARGDEDTQPAGLFPLTPGPWIGIGAVDRRGRRPFNPDAVFQRYLLEAGSPPPRIDDVVKGERGKEVSWRTLESDEQGRVMGRIAYAYARVEVPEARVALARLNRGATIFVNGVGYVGDIYGYGFGGLPVQLRKGINHIFVRGSRGGFKLTFELPPAPVFAATWSRTLPDLVSGEPTDTVGAIYVINARNEPLKGLRVAQSGNEWLAPSVSPTTYTIPPLGMLQVRLPLKTRPGRTPPPEPATPEVGLTIGATGERLLQETTLPLSIRSGTDALLRSFVSNIDDSVQMYGLRRPDTAAENARPMGLVLSLHGASVKPRGQARSYSAKPDFWHFAATNRRPFGFDWQDWGRADAYEVLAEGLRLSGVDRSRVYLTGHSMGGHGTWHLGANDPDGFAAIAPSAGWISFDTYPGPRPDGALRELWHAADAFSDTLSLTDNLIQLPTYILHATLDNDVPIAQARTMEAALKKAGAPPEAHYEEGAKHWWNGKAAKGADCVDWPGIFELFRRTQISTQPDSIRFTTTAPAVDATHHWITVFQPLIHGRRCRVEAAFEADTRLITVRTENVRALRVDHPALHTGLLLDGQSLAHRGSGPVWLTQAGAEDWRVLARAPIQGEKRPDFTGPLKQAIGRNFLFVHGTQGNPAENQALLERARYDAQQWFYRANGQTRLMTDVAYVRGQQHPGLRDRNVVLYGNETTNAAIRSLDLFRPVRCARGRLALNDRTWAGPHLGAAFVSPFSFSTAPSARACAPIQAVQHRNLAVVFADTGLAGTRLGYTAMTWVSGVGYPDYTLFDTSVLERGDGGVLAAGWLDRRWKPQPGGFLRKP